MTDRNGGRIVVVSSMWFSKVTLDFALVYVPSQILGKRVRPENRQTADGETVAAGR